MKMKLSFQIAFHETLVQVNKSGAGWHSDVLRWRLGSIFVWSLVYDSFLLNGRQLSISGERRHASGDSCLAFSQYVIHASFFSTSLREAGLLLCAKWRRAKCRLESSSLSLLFQAAKPLGRGTCIVSCERHVVEASAFNQIAMETVVQHFS